MSVIAIEEVLVVKMSSDCDSCESSVSNPILEENQCIYLYAHKHIHRPGVYAVTGDFEVYMRSGVYAVLGDFERCICGPGRFCEVYIQVYMDPKFF